MAQPIMARVVVKEQFQAVVIQMQMYSTAAEQTHKTALAVQQVTQTKLACVAVKEYFTQGVPRTEWKA